MNIKINKKVVLSLLLTSTIVLTGCSKMEPSEITTYSKNEKLRYAYVVTMDNGFKDIVEYSGLDYFSVINNTKYCQNKAHIDYNNRKHFEVIEDFIDYLTPEEYYLIMTNSLNEEQISNIYERILTTKEEKVK